MSRDRRLTNRLRRPSWPVNWAALALTVTLAVILGPALAGAHSLSGVELLQRFAPWSADAPAGSPQRLEVVGDVVNGILPMRQTANDRLAAGDVPLWTALPAGGAALALTPDMAFLSPPQLPFLLLPLWYAPAAVKLVEMLVAAAFTALFLRRLQAGWFAGLIGGAVYASSGFQLAWTGWPQATVGALIPVLFWSVERAVQQRTAGSLAVVALATAAMVATGFPAVTGWALLACGAYAIVRVWGSPAAALRRIGLLVGLGGAVILGILLLSVQLLPFLVGIDERGGLGYRAQDPSAHLPLAALATTVVPRALGLWVDGSWFGPRNIVEIQSFIGVTAVVLMAAAFVLRRRMSVATPQGAVPSLWGVLAVSVVLVYVGGPLLGVAQDALPQLFGGNFVGRLRSMVGFSAAALAGLGAQALVQHRRVRMGRPELWRSVVVVLAAAGLWVVVSSDLQLWVKSAEQRNYVIEASYLPLAVALTLVCLSVAAGISRRGHSVWRVALPVLVAVEALAIALPYLPRTERALFYPETSAHEFVSRSIGSDRLLAAGRAFFPGSTTYYDIRSTVAHTFLEPEWRELMLAADPGAFRSYTYPTFRMPPDDPGLVATSPVLDRLSTRLWAADPAAPLIGRVGRRGPAGPAVTLVAGQTVERPIAAGAVRGVVVRLATPWSSRTRRAELVATIVGPSGAVLTTGSRRLDQSRSAQLPVPMVETVVPSGSSLRLELRAAAGRIELRGDLRGRPLMSVVTAEADGLRLVFADGVTLYQRTESLPRVRWAGRRVVQPDPVQRLALLSSGRLPDDTVVLNSAQSEGSGAGGRVAVVKDESEHVVVDVDAGGDGWLVVADASQDGYLATVDGRPAEVLPADHAVIAVAVPSGASRVELVYAPPEVRTGAIISILVAGALLGLCLAPWVRRRWRATQLGYSTGRSPKRSAS